MRLIAGMVKVARSLLALRRVAASRPSPPERTALERYLLGL
jgi:hypothetical protein